VLRYARQQSLGVRRERNADEIAASFSRILSLALEDCVRFTPSRPISGSDRARRNPPHAPIARAFPPSATGEGARRFELDEDRWIEARDWDPRGWQGGREGGREKAEREREREREREKEEEGKKEERQSYGVPRGSDYARDRSRAPPRSAGDVIPEVGQAGLTCVGVQVRRPRVRACMRACV